jgi:hypothetical protein
VLSHSFVIRVLTLVNLVEICPSLLPLRKSKEDPRLGVRLTAVLDEAGQETTPIAGTLVMANIRPRPTAIVWRCGWA